MTLAHSPQVPANQAGAITRCTSMESGMDGTGLAHVVEEYLTAESSREDLARALVAYRQEARRAKGLPLLTPAEVEDTVSGYLIRRAW